MKQFFTNVEWQFQSERAFLGIAIVIMFFGIGTSYANNIQVSNVSVRGQNTTDHYTMIKFDLSWDNSWRV
ncbi:MAG: hypothetical protein DSY76_06195, partial [Bacteroidetes bacterium]